MASGNVDLSKVDITHPINFSVLYLGQIPHEKQKEVLISPHKNKVVVCGRRAGKSQMVGAELIRGGITKEYMRQMLIAPTYKQAMIVMSKVQEVMHLSKNGNDILKVIDDGTGGPFALTPVYSNPYKGNSWDNSFRIGNWIVFMSEQTV